MQDGDTDERIPVEEVEPPRSRADGLADLRDRARRKVEQEVVRLRKDFAQDSASPVHELEVRRSEEEYSNLFENAREAFVLIDLQGHITGVNQLVEEYGFKREEMIGKSLLDLVVEDHRARAMADFQVLLDGKPVEGEMDVVTPNGVISVEYRDNPIQRGGRIVGVQAILTDVTQRKRADHLLREERDKAQKYLNIAGVVLMVIDSEGKVALINKKGCEILGCTEQEVLGKNWFDHFLPERIRSEIRDLSSRMLKGEIEVNEHYENPVLTKNGDERLIRWRSVVLRDEKGVVIGHLSSGEDITERRRAEEAYRSLVDHSLQGMVILEDGKTVFANQAMAEITGYAIDEMLAMSAEQVRDFIHPEDRAVVWQNYRRRLAGEPMPEQYELRGIRKDGTIRWLDIHANRIDFLGKPAVQAACIDITERKEAEAALGLNQRILEISNRHTVRVPMLQEMVSEIRDFTGCPCVGIRLLDADGNIPYKAYVGFAEDFYERESPLSIKSDRCMCINVIKGQTDPGQPFNTAAGSFYMNGTTRFLATISPEAKGQTRNVCNEVGYESVALIPIRCNGDILGLIHVADTRENRVPLRMVQTLESIAAQLGASLRRDYAEEAMRHSEAKYRRLHESMRDGFASVEMSGRLVEFNDAYREMLGYSEEELHHLTYQDLTPNKWHDMEARIVSDQILTRGYSDVYEKEYRRKDGTVFPIELRVVLIRDDAHQPVSMWAVARDITERKRAEEALRESEGKYRELFENAREAIVISNMNKIITDANRFIEEYGFRKADLIGRSYLDFVVESYREKAIQDFELLRHGTPLEGEFEVLTPKGQVTVFYRDCPLVRNGRVVGVQSMLTDITERKRAEEALRESESRYRLLAENASDEIWTADLSLRFTYYSPSIVRASGYTPEEVLGKGPEGFLTPASYEQAMRVLADEMDLEKKGLGDPLRSRMVEIEEIRKDGTTYWAEVKAGFLRDANGRAVGIVGVSRDISERKKLEHEIVTREKYLNSFFTGATAGLALLDKDLRYIQINDTLAEMNGVPVKDHLGRTVREVAPHIAPMVEPFFQRVLATGEPVLDVEVTGQTPDRPGIQRYWMESFFPMAGTDGTPEVVGAIVVEITGRKWAEQQLLENQNKLRQLATELTLAEERERRRIAVGVHDQIGQRLALAKLKLQMLGSSLSEADVVRTLEGVCKEIDLVIEDAHSLTFELSNPVLHEVGLVGAVESWLTQQVHGKYGIECTFTADKRSLGLDQETSVTLFHIVREVLTNVIKHAKAKHVVVRIRRIGETVQIAVQDDGIGFQPAQKGCVVSKSGGFGLFNVQEKLDYLGGSVKIESEPGKGSCVVVMAPLMRRT